jgi:LacI family transcriptional regulator
MAGVSIKTVSRVVNEERGVHPATADRVLAAIERLGFRRNFSARHLRKGGETGIVGVILEDLANPFYSTLTRAVEQVAQRYGRQVLAGSSGRDRARERELALEFCARRVDGLLVVPVTRSHGYLADEINAGTPVVFMDRPGGELDADTVLLDNAGGAEMAVRHLASHGHRRIAFLGDAPDIHTAAERLRGFQDGCARAGIGHDPELVAMGPHTDESVAMALAGTRGATALITGNNRITVFALRALAGAAQRPALVGFDDFELADLLDPPITVIASDTWALGRSAAEMLFARLDGESGPPRTLVIPTRLLPRGSGEEAP